LTKILSFITTELDGTVTTVSVNIGDTTHNQLLGEAPILFFQDTKWEYCDGNDDYIEYAPVREFTVTVDDDRNATVFETADPENVL
jgi:hypothetical protein